MPTSICLTTPRTLAHALPLLGILLGTSQGLAATLWKGDFETGDLSQWDSTNLIKTGERDNLVFVTDKVADGSKAAQITLRDDVIFEPFNQSRVEVKHEGLHTKNDEDSYYAWSFMVPGDAEIRSNIGYWESLVSFKNTMCFWIEPGQGGTVLKFGTGNLGETLRWTVKLELNKWHRIAIHNKWSQQQADGKVDVWFDGAQVVTAATATKYDANELFFQMGLHRSDPSPPVQVIYIDAAVETDSMAELLQPLPDPMGMAGTSGMGGLAGAGGTAGGAGASGSPQGGAPSAGAGAGGTSAGQSAGGVPVAGNSGTGQAGSGTSKPPVTPGGATTDDGGCSVSGSQSLGGRAWLALLGGAALLVGRRRRAT